MNKVKIMSDSTCDLSEDILERFDIEVMPHPVLRGDELLLDNVSITPEDIYAYHRETGKLCKTSAPNSYDYKTFWEPWLAQGYDIVYFTISSKASSAYSHAQQAASETDGHVWAIDSKSLSTGVGLLILDACELRDQGLSAEVIAKRVSVEADRIKVGFLVDNIEYLWKGGRCSSVEAFGATLLKIKPRIDIVDGVMLSRKKYRGNTMRCFSQLADDMLKDQNIRQDRMFITHSVIDPAIIEMIQEKIRLYQPGMKEVFVTKTGATVSCHCGPGTLGILYMSDK